MKILTFFQLFIIFLTNNNTFSNLNKDLESSGPEKVKLLLLHDLFVKMYLLSYFCLKFS